MSGRGGTLAGERKSGTGILIIIPLFAYTRKGKTSQNQDEGREKITEAKYSTIQRGEKGSLKKHKNFEGISGSGKGGYCLNEERRNFP